MKQVKSKQLQAQESHSHTPHNETNINQLTEVKGLTFLGSLSMSGLFSGELVGMTHQQNIWSQFQTTS